MPDQSHISTTSRSSRTSTTASRRGRPLIEFCGALEARDESSVPRLHGLERERGITIKAQTVRLNYPAKDGRPTSSSPWTRPAVDFGAVSRYLAACEGAAGGRCEPRCQAQTLANVYQAIDAGLEIVRSWCRSTTPAAEPRRIKQQIEDTSASTLPARCRSRQRRGSASATCSRPWPRVCRRQRQPERTAEGVAHRQLVRRLSWRRHASASLTATSRRANASA